jgi:FtsZ-binding cell division protein ZapB
MLIAKEAADRVGRTKAGILKAIKTGRMSATKGGNGEWLIDPAELFRVYQPVATDLPNSASAHTTETAGLRVELAVEREKREALERERECEREQLESQIADLKQDRDFWRQQATALLADHRPEPQPVPPRRGLQGWLHRITT